jgi:hypothetical protein
VVSVSLPSGENALLVMTLPCSIWGTISTGAPDWAITLGGEHRKKAKLKPTPRHRTVASPGMHDEHDSNEVHHTKVPTRGPPTFYKWRVL